jgi:8-oxo-dGTP pyrophosphatase MutT (NUDIX family)
MNIPTPTPAATLILVRHRPAGIGVYLLRRSTASKFMPGTYVFPGGSLDADDMDIAFWRQHIDLPPDQLAPALDGPVDRMLPFAVAAIRETWEEAGLLLAAPGHKRASAGRTGDGIPFSRRIQAAGLRLCVSALGRWHHWITPELMPRRFDTYFFTAPVEPDRVCRPDNHETVDGIWISPQDALEKNARGTLPLSPPTLVTLHQMLDIADLDGLMHDVRRRAWPPPIMPRLWPLEKNVLIIEPWDPDYPRETVSVDVDRLESDLLPVGAPFSRLWRRNGIFRPVRHPKDISQAARRSSGSPKTRRNRRS